MRIVGAELVMELSRLGVDTDLQFLIEPELFVVDTSPRACGLACTSGVERTPLLNKFIMDDRRGGQSSTDLSVISGPFRLCSVSADEVTLCWLTFA